MTGLDALVDAIADLVVRKITPMLGATPKLTYTRDEASEALQLSTDVIDNWIATGRLERVRDTGRRVLLTRESVERAAGIPESRRTA